MSKAPGNIPHQPPKTGFAGGLKEGIGIFIGYMPIALAFGLLSKNTGLSLAHTTGMSLIVFAGASQFMALELIAIGTGHLEIVFSTFMVNIRHLLMSMSLHERIPRESKPRKAFAAFFVTDEVFAVASTREGEVRSTYIYGLGIMAYLGWTIHTGIGYVAGTFLPVNLQEGMGVALYAMFIGLLVPAVHVYRKAFFLAAAAAVLNSLFGLFLPTGWAIISAVIVAVLLFEFIGDTSSGDTEEGGE